MLGLMRDGENAGGMIPNPAQITRITKKNCAVRALPGYWLGLVPFVEHALEPLVGQTGRG